MLTRILSIIFFIIFAAFAYLQLNDPDPAKWVIVYGVVAIVSLLRAFKVYHKGIFLILIISLAAMACFYVPGFIEYLAQPNKNEIVGEMVYKKPYIEETREFIGLIMAMGALFFGYRNS